MSVIHKLRTLKYLHDNLWGNQSTSISFNQAVVIYESQNIDAKKIKQKHIK